MFLVTKIEIKDRTLNSLIFFLLSKAILFFFVFQYRNTSGFLQIFSFDLNLSLYFQKYRIKPKYIYV